LAELVKDVVRNIFLLLLKTILDESYDINAIIGHLPNYEDIPKDDESQFNYMVQVLEAMESNASDNVQILNKIAEYQKDLHRAIVSTKELVYLAKEIVTYETEAAKRVTPMILYSRLSDIKEDIEKLGKMVDFLLDPDNFEKLKNFNSRLLGEVQSIPRMLNTVVPALDKLCSSLEHYYLKL